MTQILVCKVGIKTLVCSSRNSVSSNNACQALSTKSGTCQVLSSGRNCWWNSNTNLHVSTIKGCWWGEGRGLTGFLCLCLGQASSATAKQTGKLAEFMCNLAWDFPVKEGFKVFKEMLATKPLMGSHHSWSRPQSLLRTPDTRSYVTSTDSSPARASKGALIFSPEGLSPQVRELYQQLKEFMARHVYPDEPELQRH